MSDAYILLLLLLLLVNERVRINRAQEPFEKKKHEINGYAITFRNLQIDLSGGHPHHVHGSRYMINVREKTRLVINRDGQERARVEFAYGSTIKYPIIIIIILPNFLL